jgi:glycosyltransferase involved in cell wall biosynthesis
MRVLYVCLDRGIPIGGSKGASIHVAEMLRGLEAEGAQTAIVARSAVADVSQPLFPAEVPARGSTRKPSGGRMARYLHRDLREVGFGPRFCRVLRRAIGEFRPDLIYERYALFRTEGCREARRAGLPLILEVNAPLAWEERRFRGLALVKAAQAAERRIWAQADLVVVPSFPMRRRVLESGQHRVLVVPNAVDPERFSPIGTVAAAELRAILGLEANFVIAFSGSLKWWHDLDALVDAAAGLPEDVRAALLLVGDGPERTRLESRAAAAGLRCVLTGAVPHEDVPRYLGIADVCVAGLSPDPALDYFSPLKALEYLAAGAPTVVAAAGDLGAVAEAGAALSYPPGNAVELRRGLELLATDPELRALLSSAGRAYAESRTWRAAAREILREAQPLMAASVFSR